MNREMKDLFEEVLQEYLASEWSNACDGDDPKGDIEKAKNMTDSFRKRLESCLTLNELIVK